MFEPSDIPGCKPGKYAPYFIENFAGCWDVYTDGHNTPTPNCGKWMYFFRDPQGRAFANKMCDLAVGKGIVQSAKAAHADVGVSCFYIDGTDVAAHQRIIQFFIDHDMIRRTKTGKLYNISFKFDEQTHSDQYGADFTAQIKLDQFVDLNTGEMLPNPRL